MKGRVFLFVRTISVLAPTVFLTRNLFLADSRISSCVIEGDKKQRVAKRPIEVFGPKRSYERPCVAIWWPYMIIYGHIWFIYGYI